MKVTSLHKALKAGKWAHRKDEPKGPYIYLDEDGCLLSRHGEPGSGSVETGFEFDFEDIETQWVVFDPQQRLEDNANQIESELLAKFSEYGGQITSENIEYRMAANSTYSGSHDVMCKIEDNKLVIGIVKRYRDDFDRVFERGKFEWLREARVLGKALRLLVDIPKEIKAQRLRDETVAIQ